MKKFFLFAAAAMMALVGCEKQTQSSLDFADVKNEAKITGQLGFWYAEPGGETNFVGLANQKIWFEVKAGDYAVNTNDAIKVFEATTTAGDSAGYFTITVSLGEKDLKGDLKTDVIRYEYNGKIFYFNEYKREGISLITGNNKVSQVVVKKDEVLSECVGEGQLKGKLLRDAGTLDGTDFDEAGKIAAEGFKVIAHVTYQTYKDDGTKEDIVKDFVATSDKNGEFLFKAIPAYDKGNKAKIEVKKKDASYRKYEDNKWIETTRPFWLAETDVDDIKINEVSDAGKKELQYGDLEEDMKMEKKVVVKGEIFAQAEELVYDVDADDKKFLKEVKYGTKKYTPEINGGKFQIVLKNKTKGASLIYDAKVDDEGKYGPLELAVYNAWAFNDIEISIDIKDFVNDKYMHYFYYPQYKKDGSWTDNPNKPNYWVEKDVDNYVTHYGSQECEGLYKIKENKGSYNGFFAAKVDATLEFTMNPESAAILKGNGKTDANGNKIDYKKDEGKEYHQFAGGLTGERGY